MTESLVGERHVEEPDGCGGAIVEVVELCVDVVVEATEDDVVVEEDVFNELEHAPAATRRDKEPRNATETRPAFFALIAVPPRRASGLP